MNASIFMDILKNTMNMISLRSLASIAVTSLMLAWAATGEVSAASKDAVKSSPDSLGKMTEGAGPEEGTAVTEPVQEKSEPAKKKKDKKAKEADEQESDKGSKESKEESRDSKEPREREQKEPKEKKTKVEAPSAAELAAQALVLERARLLKLEQTPFNSANNESAHKQDTLAPLTIRSGGNSLRSRLVPNRVYLPAKMIIGKPADFVVKGRPGSHVAIAMADKDSGAKPVFGQKLRLGPDRKLMAAGVVPASGILTLIVDMPIQGDLIGLPVFFETVIWQKPDFSDLELAAPVKSETVAEFADKPNAVLVAGEIIEKGRGLKFKPDSAVPLHQRGSSNLESGRP